MLCSWVRRQITERSILSKLVHIICDFNKNFTTFFTEIGKLVTKFTWNFKEPKLAKAMLKKNKIV